MNTFLKVLVLIVAAVLAVKLLPMTLAVGLMLAAGLVLFTILGVSALVVVLCVGVALAALLSPVWIPVLALVGVIALIKRLNRPSNA